MFRAEIAFSDEDRVDLGPTETRDEASRLARSWMDRHPFDPKGTGTQQMVTGVKIKRVEEESAS